MNKLEELIKKYCPDGVPHLPLEEVTHYSKTRIMISEVTINTYVGVENLLQNKQGKTIANNIPTSGTIIGYEKDDILIGNIRPYLRKIWLADCNGGTNGDVLTIQINDKSKLTPQFLFYLLSSEAFFDYDNQNSKGAKMPRGDKSAIMKYIIPIPPIEVQHEIVRILDKYTASVTELQKKITAELETRRKQYEYYRDRLLSFDVHGGGTDSVEWRTLGEVIISLNTGLNPRQFFKLNTDDAQNYYVTIREIQNGTVVFSEKTDKINDEALRLCNNRSNLEVGDVLFSGTGTIGETAVIKETPTNWNIKEGVYTIKPNKTLINSRFLMFLLRTSPIKTAIKKKTAGGTVQSIPMAELKKINIPVPALDLQEKIVSVLDNFDAICSNLSIGLPAEIEARQKQYEYYRDALLSFDSSYFVNVERERERERER